MSYKDLLFCSPEHAATALCKRAIGALRAKGAAVSQRDEDELMTTAHQAVDIAPDVDMSALSWAIHTTLRDWAQARVDRGLPGWFIPTINLEEFKCLTTISTMPLPSPQP